MVLWRVGLDVLDLDQEMYTDFPNPLWVCLAVWIIE